VNFEITIIGSGVVGSVLASLLAKQGIEICLIDRQNPYENSKNSELSSRTAAINLASIDLFIKLELWDYLKKEATDFNKICVWDGEGSSRLEFSANDIGRNRLGSVVGNNQILKELSSILQESDNVDLKFNRELISISANDNSVEVQTEQGEKIVSKLLVGADGGMSKVRQLLKIATKSWSYNQTAFVGSLKSEKPHANTAWQIFSSSGPIALLPFDRRNKANISLVWSVESKQAEKIKSLDSNNFVSLLQKETESILGAFQLLDDLKFFPLNQLYAKNYFSKRTLLVGDAAHIMHPLAGQGLNLGFADVFNLYEILVSARRKGEDLGEDKVLFNYENSRKISNLTMAAMMEIFKRGFDSSNPWITLGRNLIFQATQESGWLKRKFIERAAGIT